MQKDTNLVKFGKNTLCVFSLRVILQTCSIGFKSGEYGGNFIKTTLSRISAYSGNASKTIQISDFLLERYKDQQLFYDPQNPTEAVICEKGKRILNKLGICATSKVDMSKILNDTEIFIYESVRKALDLSYRQEYIRVGQEHASLQTGCLSRKEYIEEVISWNFGVS